MQKQFVRSQHNLGDYNDDEKGFEPSIVDTSGYEPLEVMIAKFLRGDSKPRFDPSFGVAAGGDPEAAIAEMDLTRTDGFDIVDGMRHLRQTDKDTEALSKEHAQKKAEREAQDKADLERLRFEEKLRTDAAKSAAPEAPNGGAKS